MNIITVHASQTYNVHIGANLLQNVGSCVREIVNAKKAAIISDSNVWPLWGDAVVQSLLSSGFTCVSFVFPSGEQSKNINTYLDILNFLAENEITRSDILIALGGGVVGDISGFAAATYLRGISYIQLPTSLLAMVDSSVGGKTAIDLPSGKNLVGAFKQPTLVLCDTDTLSTLPDNIFLDGCAEVIKYAILFDTELFDYLQQTGADFDREFVITKCINHKRNIVESDEFDTGLRQKLNLGHTVGHGIEAKSNYKITHGQSVAAGMAIVTKAAANRGLCAYETYHSICSILEKFSLPVSTGYSAAELYTSALGDKKRSGSALNLIIPRQIGNCEIIAAPIQELESFIQAGL